MAKFGNKLFNKKVFGSGNGASAPQTGSGLAQIDLNSPIGFDKAKHLMRRASFAGSFDQIDALAAMNINDALDVIFSPISYTQINPIGATITQKSQSRYDWWEISENTIPNWYGKFSYFIFNMLPAEIVGASAKDEVAWFNFLHDSVYRSYKDTISAVTRDHNMGRRLNIADNIASAPNENYAREVMELFTLSPGPQIAVGDYTYYTEDDIVQAARVLTGFRRTNSNVQMNSISSFHDSGDKTFSAAFQNTVITGQSDPASELPFFIDMLFAQPRVADYLALRLHRYYIGDVTDQTVLNEIAASLINNNYEFENVLKDIFKSEYFYKTDNTAQQFMSPIEAVYYCINYFNADIDLNIWINRDQTSTQLANMGELFMNPPEIKGWAPRYQEPDLNDLWANATTSQFYSDTMKDLCAQDGHNVIASYATSTDLDTAIDAVYKYTNADPIDSDIRDVIRTEMLQGGAGFHWTNATPTEKEDLLIKMMAAIAKLGEFKVQ